MENDISPLVYAVILNTNRRDDTLECLRSLERNRYPNLHVVVLDNASTDGSAEAIRRDFPAVEILPLTANKGYAGNNNVGMQHALDCQAAWVLVLNEDTILAEDCVQSLVEAGEAEAKAGVVGPMVYHHNETGVIQTAGGFFDRNWEPYHDGANQNDTGQYRQVREVDWISGCAMLIRRQALEQAGLIDERFFYYNEEVDLCYRIQHAGWKNFLVPQARLWHKGVQRDYQPSPNVTYYKIRNFFLFLDKNGAPLPAKLHAWTRTCATLLSFTLRPKWKHKKAHRDAMAQGLRDYLTRQWGMRKV